MEEKSIFYIEPVLTLDWLKSQSPKVSDHMNQLHRNLQGQLATPFYGDYSDTALVIEVLPAPNLTLINSLYNELMCIKLPYGAALAIGVISAYEIINNDIVDIISDGWWAQYTNPSGKKVHCAGEQLTTLFTELARCMSSKL